MLSLAAMFAVLGYASPATAEVKFGGDASVRLRGSFTDSEYNDNQYNNEDDLLFQYRVRLKASADLGSGYFFKGMLQTEQANGSTVIGGGWADADDDISGIEISQFYFGRMMEDSHYMIGRLPLNSVNNPIFDITLYPIPTKAHDHSSGSYNQFGNTAVDIPVATWNFDRVFGLNYGRKIGPGELNSTLVVFDNATGDDSDLEGDGTFNDGYALHLSYKVNVGDITLEPQAIIGITDLDGAIYQNVSPNTFGMNVGIPAGKAKIGLSGFYTVCDDTNPNTNQHVDYSGYLLRIKGEYGPFTAWVDYNQTEDNTASWESDYDNLFVWAQYNYKVYESAMGTFSLTPTVRYRSSGKEFGSSEYDESQLRTELYATVTF